MYKIKYEEFDEYVHNLNLYDISSVIRHIELGDELYLFKHKKQFIDHLKHLLDSGYTYRKLDHGFSSSIEFYNDTEWILFTVGIAVDNINYAECVIEKKEVFKLKKNDDIIKFIIDKILNNKCINLQKTSYGLY